MKVYSLLIDVEVYKDSCNWKKSPFIGIFFIPSIHFLQFLIIALLLLYTRILSVLEAPAWVL
jgi:hypothetical protein